MKCSVPVVFRWTQPELRARQIGVGWMPFEATPAELQAQQDRAIDAYKRWIARTNFKGE